MKNKELQNYKAIREQLYEQGSPLHLSVLLARCAYNYPEKVALIYSGDSITYAAWYTYVLLAVKTMRSYGVHPGDRVMVCMENSAAFYIAYYAALMIGGIVVPVNVFLKDKELKHIVNDSEPSYVFYDLKFEDVFKAVKLPLKGAIDTPSMMEQFDNIPLISVQKEHLSNPSWYKPDEMMVLVYTSGTTGAPKGVMLTSTNIITNICQSIARLEVQDEERICAVLPLFHVFAQIACVWIPVVCAATVIIVHKIDRASLLKGLTLKPTAFLGVPALYGLLCMMKNAPLDSIRLFVCGGDALPDKIRMLFSLLYRRRIVNGYGMSEAAPVIAINCEDTMSYTNTVGTPLQDIEIAVLDEKYLPCPQGVSGRLWVKGKNVMLGYYKDQNATDAVMMDGWLDTGDCAYVDGMGKVVITGREKDLIIHKGFNVYPQEVENVILSHSLVIRVGVVGKKDDEVGQIPVAFVQVRSITPTLQKELKNLCSNYLANYKIPREFICNTKDLPLTATAKVDKKILITWL